ncbi:cobalt-precorrin-5B (C(1))-methyltransferase [Vibrio sp. LaRot3]|uniref:cobalt-precorrin-5B (C(1))-methyltransferase n=1 Tax=Vibrio sp. LaRot3 TaxID=2998829 RepID=UPI0022CE03A7|nr:cobalt-precorrin-5B (C(1))-methyltransferase [Vibrio sp. LaRot3]MDA0149601.1 cobalt-precorrin-5B (C(1))-methyltransferase [Vibrio sp. LaRot3]
MSRLKRSSHKGELRTGFTTGACAAAASAAAARALLSKQNPSNITITLPNGDNAEFAVNYLPADSGVLAQVIKDGGDDPDCTHGLAIHALIEPINGHAIEVKGGLGVATVTLPGLELAVGQPAINPVPKANILAMVERERKHSEQPTQGLVITISVPKGEEAAKQTISERLGLIGGISILGTRGTVKPFSTSAYAASVRQSIEIGTENGHRAFCLTTGGRTEAAAMKIYPQFVPMQFIQAGDFIGVGLRCAKRCNANSIHLVVMIGKLCKLISGRMMTHVSGHGIDFGLLADRADHCGYPSHLVNEIANSRTGRQVLDLVRGTERQQAFLADLCLLAQQHASEYIKHQFPVEVTLVDFDGPQLANSFPINQRDNESKSMVSQSGCSDHTEIMDKEAQ